MQNADYLIGEVLKEGLVGDVATAIGTGVAAKAAHNVVKKAIPLAIKAAKSPMARAAGRAAMTAASVAAPGVGRLAIKAAPILAGAYVAHKINQSSGSSSH